MTEPTRKEEFSKELMKVCHHFMKTLLDGCNNTTAHKELFEMKALEFIEKWGPADD